MLDSKESHLIRTITDNASSHKDKMVSLKHIDARSLSPVKHADSHSPTMKLSLFKNKSARPGFNMLEDYVSEVCLLDHSTL